MDRSVFSAFIPSLEARTAEEAIKELCSCCAASDRDAAAEAVLRREKEGSTAIGNGVAIPHARTDSVEEADGVIGVSREGIHVGGEAVHLFILILIPSHPSSDHVLLLADIAKVLSDPKHRQAVEAAADLEEAAGVFGL